VLEQVQPAYEGPRNVAGAFTHGDTHPLVLGLLLLKTFKTEYLAWEPETVWAEIYLSFGVTPSAAARNKVQSVRSCMVANSPYEQWDIFEDIAFGLLGLPAKFDSVQKAAVKQCAFAVECLSSLRQDVQVSTEVYKYCAASMMDEGMAFCPGQLEPANMYLRDRTEIMPGLQDSVRLLVANNAGLVVGRSAAGLQAAKAREVALFVSLHRNRFIEQSRTLLGA